MPPVDAPSRTGSLDGRVPEMTPDPDGPIWKNGAFHTDPWQRLADDAPLPAQPVIVSKARWLKERTALADRGVPLGLHLKAGESIDDLAGDFGRFAVIALDFPKFSDGRSFSIGRLLREKHGYKGELRATGNVLSDQIPFMRRVDFDAFEVTHAPTRTALAEGRIREVTLHYQPVSGVRLPDRTRPWLRQSRS